jgi:anti-sigma-K factor RskA
MDIQAYIASGIIELYVMGLCTPEEEQELEQLRIQYPALQQAIHTYEVQMESNMMQQSTLPSIETDEKILDTLASLQTAPVVSIKPTTTTKKIKWLKPLAAASVILLMGSAFLNYSLLRNNKRLNSIVKAETKSPLPLADYEIFTNPSITPVGMYGQGSHAICRCTMFWDKKTGKAYIMIHHLPKSNDATDYQLWAEIDGKQVSVGIIDDNIRGRFIEVQNVPAATIAFKVTLGKTGGESTIDKGDLYLAGRI